MSRLVAATIGRLSPRFRTVAQFSEIYWQTLIARDLSPKTMMNHAAALKYLNAAIGPDTINWVRPHAIANPVRVLHQRHPHAAQRVLAEARALFAEAVALGWADQNPAAEVRMPVARIQRQRITLEQWHAIAAYATANMPPWTYRMMVLGLVTGQRRGDLCKMQFEDVRGGYLHVSQQKTGTLLRIPTALRLDIVGISVGEAVEMCRDYSRGNVFLLRKSNGHQLSAASMSARFETAREAALGRHTGEGMPPSLHEIRSLCERLYRDQGVDTRRLLGHTRQSMTDVYNHDRGLSGGKWMTLEIQPDPNGGEGVQDLRSTVEDEGQPGARGDEDSHIFSSCGPGRLAVQL